MVSVLALCATAVMVTLPGFLLTTFFGEEYLPGAEVVGLLALSSTGLALVSVLMHYHLAFRNRVSAVLPWLGAFVAVIAITQFHNSITVIAGVMFVVTMLVLVVMAQRAFATREGIGESSFVSKELWDLVTPDLDLTIVVPYFNPGEALRATLERLVEVLRSLPASFEVIAVSDGSTDGSELTLRGFAPDVVRSVILDRNTGKGQALRVGFAMGRGRYLGFIDADGDIDPITIDSFLSLMNVYKPDIILGSKRHPMSDVKYPPLRRIYSWGYQQLIRILFRLNIRDTQTGLKLVRREVIAAVLPRMLEKRFAFDLELFVVARHLGFRNLFEAPVRIERRFTSTVSPKAVWGTFLDTLAIFYRLQLLHFYDAEHVAAVDLFSDIPGSLTTDIGRHLS